jgi:hypothetical protein
VKNYRLSYLRLARLNCLRLTSSAFFAAAERDLREPGAWPEYGFGGLLTMDTGTRDLAKKLREDLQDIEGFGFMAVSLGYFDTLMSCSASSTASEMDEQAIQNAEAYILEVTAKKPCLW